MLLVSRSISKRTTQHLPHLFLRLSDQTTTQQVQQWFQATHQLHYVPTMHMLISSKVTGGVFELAVQLLSQHANIKELHILSALNKSEASCMPGMDSLPSLQPLHHLLHYLHTLVIDGVTVECMANDLQQLSAASVSKKGWQLQKLAINADWRPGNELLWSEFSKGMQYLGQAFPDLRSLSMRHPLLTPIPDFAYNGTDPAPDETEIHAINFLLGVVNRAEPVDAEYAEAYWRELQLSTAAAMVAVASTVLHIKTLQCLTIVELPDMWRRRQVQIAYTDPSLQALASTAARDKAAAVAEAMLKARLLPPVTSAATVTFQTLDEYGCWLLQQHPELIKVAISTERKGLAMSWQKQQSQQQKQQQLSLQEMFAINLAISGVTAPRPMVDKSTNSLAGSLAEGIKWRIDHLSHQHSGSKTHASVEFINTRVYSFRPATQFMSHISSCHLALKMADTPGLAELLGNLKALKHLKVSSWH